MKKMIMISILLIFLTGLVNADCEVRRENYQDPLDGHGQIYVSIPENQEGSTFYDRCVDDNTFIMYSCDPFSDGNYETHDFSGETYYSKTVVCPKGDIFNGQCDSETDRCVAKKECTTPGELKCEANMVLTCFSQFDNFYGDTGYSWTGNAAAGGEKCDFSCSETTNECIPDNNKEQCLENSHLYWDATLNKCVKADVSSHYIQYYNVGCKEEGKITKGFNEEEPQVMITKTDTCSGNTLTDYSCTGRYIASKEKVCENGCENGACNGEVSSSQEIITVTIGEDFIIDIGQTFKILSVDGNEVSIQLFSGEVNAEQTTTTTGTTSTTCSSITSESTCKSTSGCKPDYKGWIWKRFDKCVNA
ncbi:hypothetical protein C0585_04350 [Candidatus Woesearchaeota archaeon]|nr:MAG: hypothetical protein C0585_04350 [Candidatus Woesearchaeota archaeon]